MKYRAAPGDAHEIPTSQWNQVPQIPYSSGIWIAQRRQWADGRPGPGIELSIGNWASWFSSLGGTRCSSRLGIQVQQDPSLVLTPKPAGLLGP